MTARLITPQQLADLFEDNRAKHVARALGIAWNTAREYVYEGIPQRHRLGVVRVIDDVIARLEARKERLLALRKAIAIEETPARPADLALGSRDRAVEAAPPEGVGPQ
jgi:hypothetical protein